jgi:diamine N-acetyltransferase
LNDTNEAIGAIDLFDYDPFHHRAGVGILIYDAAQRGNGYAREALQILIEYTKTFLQMHQLYCNINSNNDASIQLFQSCGFQQCGNKQQWNKIGDVFVNELMFQLVF